MYREVSNCTEFTLTRMFVICHIVSSLSVGHHQVFVREHKSVHKINTIR
jgi:hypothetical protein